MVLMYVRALGGGHRLETEQLAREGAEVSLSRRWMSIHPERDS